MTVWAFSRLDGGASSSQHGASSQTWALLERAEEAGQSMSIMCLGTPLSECEQSGLLHREVMLLLQVGLMAGGRQAALGCSSSYDPVMFAQEVQAQADDAFATRAALNVVALQLLAAGKGELVAELQHVTSAVPQESTSRGVAPEGSSYLGCSFAVGQVLGGTLGKTHA